MTTRKGGQSARYALYAWQAVIVVLKAHGALQIGIAISPAQSCRRESQSKDLTFAVLCEALVLDAEEILRACARADV